ncbi:hypothetical protein JCM1840_003961 [Sporobolomyces johnsonii]
MASRASSPEEGELPDDPAPPAPARPAASTSTSLSINGLAAASAGKASLPAKPGPPAPSAPASAAAAAPAPQRPKVSIALKSNLSVKGTAALKAKASLSPKLGILGSASKRSVSKGVMDSSSALQVAASSSDPSAAPPAPAPAPAPATAATASGSTATATEPAKDPDTAQIEQRAVEALLKGDLPTTTIKPASTHPDEPVIRFAGDRAPPDLLPSSDHQSRLRMETVDRDADVTLDYDGSGGAQSSWKAREERTWKDERGHNGGAWGPSEKGDRDWRHEGRHEGRHEEHRYDSRPYPPYDQRQQRHRSPPRYGGSHGGSYSRSPDRDRSRRYSDDRADHSHPRGGRGDDYRSSRRSRSPDEKHRRPKDYESRDGRDGDKRRSGGHHEERSPKRIKRSDASRSPPPRRRSPSRSPLSPSSSPSASPGPSAPKSVLSADHRRRAAERARGETRPRSRSPETSRSSVPRRRSLSGSSNLSFPRHEDRTSRSPSRSRKPNEVGPGPSPAALQHPLPPRPPPPSVAVPPPLPPVAESGTPTHPPPHPPLTGAHQAVSFSLSASAASSVPRNPLAPPLQSGFEMARSLLNPQPPQKSAYERPGGAAPPPPPPPPAPKPAYGSVPPRRGEVDALPPPPPPPPPGFNASHPAYPEPLPAPYHAGNPARSVGANVVTDSPATATAAAAAAGGASKPVTPAGMPSYHVGLLDPAATRTAVGIEEKWVREPEVAGDEMDVDVEEGAPPHPQTQTGDKDKGGEHTFIGASHISEYTLQEKLGEGTFGVVWKGVRGKVDAKGKAVAREEDDAEEEAMVKRGLRVRKGDVVALKQIIFHNEGDGMPITSIREIRILKMLDHPNVVPVVDMALDPGDPAKFDVGKTFMVFPYMDHDLAGLLENPRVKLEVEHVKQYSKQLLEGTAYLHKNRILHRDMKAANLLISNAGTLMIADFGLARSMEKADSSKEYTNCVVTRWYRPPELLLGERRYHAPVDMWGVGCILLEMFKKSPIFPGNSDLDQAVRIFNMCGPPTDETMPGWSSLPGVEGVDKSQQNWAQTGRSVRAEGTHAAGDDFGDLLDKILVLDPKRRLTAVEALDHDWFWTDPFPTEPSRMPQYTASHEYDRRKRIENQHAAFGTVPGMQAMPRPPPQQQAFPPAAAGGYGAAPPPHPMSANYLPPPGAPVGAFNGPPHAAAVPGYNGLQPQPPMHPHPSSMRPSYGGGGPPGPMGPGPGRAPPGPGAYHHHQSYAAAGRAPVQTVGNGGLPYGPGQAMHEPSNRPGWVPSSRSGPPGGGRGGKVNLVDRLKKGR